MLMDATAIPSEFSSSPPEHQGHVMKRRNIVAAAALALLGSPAIAQQEVSRVGTWTGERTRAAKVDGYRSGPATLVITQQKGTAFEGYLHRTNKDGDVKEDLW